MVFNQLHIDKADGITLSSAVNWLRLVL